MATSKTTIHSFFLEQILHDTPEKLQKRLQKTIDEIEELQNRTEVEKEKFDAIVLAYGLCSNAVIGLKSKTLPLIIPRCDDCIALFLGSQKRYLEIFNSRSGIYWYNKPWLENTVMPSKESFNEHFQKYLEEYDEDTAEYLMESVHGWKENYECAFYIKSSICDDSEEIVETKKICEDFGWTYDEATEDLSYLSDLLNGNWDDEERFAICKPGQKFAAEYSGKKVQAVDC